MGALELREELHKYIEIGDKKLLNALHKTARQYMEQQRRLNQMIAEGEEDIAAGKIYSIAEAKKIVADWEKE
ncbi:hypothetical protein [Autumnicola musiva]|uniref:CopG family transcriptional regulator n=1 Tax=Autumnicola musiva TaxID=3075589 RepID=A0ABU3D4Y4_9FLAO|nr:hypothetical protein [Zunongwangia sp. F117]MDT0676592.1 hypothetical protein [Zunongwangia sp. F117]